MHWRTAMNYDVLGGRADAIVRRFLFSGTPRFKAPVDAAAWPSQAAARRKEVLDTVILRGFPKRIINAKPRVVWGEVLAPTSDYVIRKLRYEAYLDYWVPALLYEPTSLIGKMPVVLNPNGHHAGGKACAYKQARCINLARRGMIALNIEFIGMGELQGDTPHNNQGFLNLTGLAGVGLFYLAMSKGLDVLLAQAHADPERVAMTGLSGGGWQTILLSALDPRITVSIPVAGYTALRARIRRPEDRGDLEQEPPDLGKVCDYQELTAMLAPRPVLHILNQDDTCCFKTHRTRPLIYNAIKPTYAAFGAGDVFKLYNNRDPGTHNYDADNRAQLYRFPCLRASCSIRVAAWRRVPCR